MGSNLQDGVKVKDPETNGTLSLDDFDQAQLDEFKSSAINKAVELATTQMREELAVVWDRLQKAEAQVEINTDSNAKTLSVVRNHVHQAPPQQ